MTTVEMTNYFQPECPNLLKVWDGEIKLGSVAGKLDWKRILEPVPCGNGWIPEGFEYDGSSSGIFRFLIPKWRHPIASGRHDWRAYILRQLRAEGMPIREIHKLRRISDQLFREDIHIGQNSRTRAFIESNAGYLGTRAGAYLRIGL